MTSPARPPVTDPLPPPWQPPARRPAPGDFPPCIDCGSRSRRLTPAGDVLCACRPTQPRKENR